MCRLLGYCAREPVSVAGLLGEDGLRAFTALSALHADGWGMAWYDGAAQQIRRSPGPAVDAPEYHQLTRAGLGEIGLVHLRWATPGLGLGEHDSHPFRYGPFTLAHNGAIHPQDRLGEILPAGWQDRPAGSTDSERYFLRIMARLADHDGDVVAAISDTADHIDRLLAPNSLNAILLSPTTLYAICWYYPDRLPAAELRKRGHGHTDAEIAAYFNLAYRAGPDAVVVASSGWPQDGWEPVPNRHVLEVDRATLATSLRPLGAARHAHTG